MSRQKSNSPATYSQKFITEIEVENLFNLYSYSLSFKDLGVDSSRLLILYGDNGSGKTTLLKMVFNLLSPAMGRAHRTFLANVPFKRFAVRLGKNIYIELQRSGRTILGAYQATITKGTRKVFDEWIAAEEETDKNRFRVKPNTVASFVEQLAKLNITLYYLSDDRKTQSSTKTISENEQLILESDVEEYVVRRVVGQRQRARTPQDRNKTLELAILKLERWFRFQALKGSSEGEANTNNIYTDIVSRIARARGKRGKDSSSNIDDLTKALHEIEERSKGYSQYALITPLQISGLISTLESATVANRPIIVSVLTPYIDGLRARLDALEEVQRLIKMFIESVNSFFHNKKISFDLSKGVQIASRNGDRLKANMLSSGESQLLLLFCNTITARDEASIFIIDEPELSLNIKWQRKLLQVLLDCSEDAAVQFVIATHSVELLNRHKSHVLRLTSESGDERNGRA